MSAIDTIEPVSTPTRTDLPSLLSPREVADLLGVSERTVRRLAENGVLDRVRIGHRTSRYTRRSVEALTDPPRSSSAPAGNQGAAKVVTGDHDAGYRGR